MPLQELIQSLNSIEVHPKVAGGKIVAIVPCAKCTRTIKLVRVPPRSWAIYNIIRHFNGHINNPTSDKRKKTDIKDSSTDHPMTSFCEVGSSLQI